MMQRPRATSLWISSGSSFSRLAMYSISSVIMPCRAKCICDILRFPFAAAAPASLDSIQLSRIAMKPPRETAPNDPDRRPCCCPIHRLRSLDYGTGGAVPQLAQRELSRPAGLGVLEALPINTIQPSAKENKARDYDPVLC